MHNWHEVQKAKRILEQMRIRAQEGSLVESLREQDVEVHCIKHSNPTEWNNIPIPLQELSSHLIKHAQIIAEIS